VVRKILLSPGERTNYASGGSGWGRRTRLTSDPSNVTIIVRIHVAVGLLAGQLEHRASADAIIPQSITLRRIDDLTAERPHKALRDYITASACARGGRHHPAVERSGDVRVTGGGDDTVREIPDSTARAATRALDQNIPGPGFRRGHSTKPG